MRARIIIASAMILSILSCVKQPNEPVDNNTNTGKTGAFILCEGTWGSDNSTLDRYDFQGNTIINDYYGIANPGMKLGDLASDIVVNGDKTYISVSTAHTIDVIETSTGKSLKQLILPANAYPRKICIVNDSTAFITDQRRNCVIQIRLTTMNVMKDSIPVGPAPEQIVNYNNRIFVANSGYGDLEANMPKAGTVSVLDMNSGQEVAELSSLPNVIELAINKNAGKLYVCYYNLPSLKDSLGGIVEFDLNSLNELRRWKMDATSITLSATGDTLFFFKDSTISLLKLNDAAPSSQTLIVNPNNNEYWY